jgi:hypothetical protein
MGSMPMLESLCGTDVATVAAEMQVSRSHEASRRNDMKRIHSIIAGSLFAILVLSCGFATRLQAQDEPAVTFSIPFAFSTAGRTIPAGTYQLNLVEGQHLMSILNVKTGDMQVFSVFPDQQKSIESHGRLIFNRCGDRNELAEFHIPGTNFYSRMVPSRADRKLEAKACPLDQTVTLASR